MFSDTAAANPYIQREYIS